MKLPESFYQRSNVVKIARELLGKGLFTRIDGITTGGRIVETEAYSWKERGCHAYGARKTERNAVMFGKGGHSYVYLCYGIHNLFNIVTNDQNVADAILVRAIEPIEGIDERHRFAAGGRRAQPSPRQARAPRRCRADQFGDLSAGHPC